MDWNWHHRTMTAVTPGITQIAPCTWQIHDGMNDPLKPTSPLRMPAWGDKVSDADIRAVIAYFKSLWSPAHARQRDETRAVRHPERLTQARSAGTRTNGTNMTLKATLTLPCPCLGAAEMPIDACQLFYWASTARRY